MGTKFTQKVTVKTTKWLKFIQSSVKYKLISKITGNIINTNYK